MMLRQFWIDVRVRLCALIAWGRIRLSAQEEHQFHLAMLEQRKIEAAIAPAEARTLARREFGNPTLLTDRTLESWMYVFIDTLILDIRFALRGIRKNPVFATTAVLSLALGIGANIAIFRLFDAL